jgi:hypothetical protein
MDDSSEGTTKECNKQQSIDSTDKDKYNRNESEVNVSSMIHISYDNAKKHIDSDSHPSQPKMDPKSWIAVNKDLKPNNNLDTKLSP